MGVPENGYNMAQLPKSMEYTWPLLMGGLCLATPEVIDIDIYASSLFATSQFFYMRDKILN